MEQRTSQRASSSLPVQVSVGPKTWRGTCINLSTEGALLKLDAGWEGDCEVDFRLDPDVRSASLPTAAQVVRASSPDHQGTFLAVRFLHPLN